MRRLELLEKEWLDSILKAEFKDKEVLIKQAEEALIKAVYNSGYISICFKKMYGEKYPHNVRVPVEMRAYQKDKAPIVFVLHVVNGYLNELEIFSADGSELNANCICLDKTEYVIDSKVQF